MAKEKPHLTKMHIEQYLRLEEERKELQRRARNLAQKSQPLKSKIWQFIDAAGGKQRSVVRSGFLLSIDLTKGAVSWKAEFVKLAGDDEAEKLIEAAPPREVLKVRKAA